MNANAAVRDESLHTPPKKRSRCLHANSGLALENQVVVRAARGEQ
eukprot:COSAG06_NODE_642_length_13482_cov_21.927296_15_plen_45_part_00